MVGNFINWWLYWNFVQELVEWSKFKTNISFLNLKMTHRITQDFSTTYFWLGFRLCSSFASYVMKIQVLRQWWGEKKDKSSGENVHELSTR